MIPAEDLAAFHRWMVKRGRSPDTANQYVGKITACYEDSRGVTARLTQNGLAPKSRRQNLAALRAWAKYSKDHELRDRLDDLKMPPPERVLEKTPLTEDEWADVIDALAELEEKLDPVMHASIEMICIRGFRVGDVVRLERSEISQAMRTGVLNYQAKGGRQLRWEAAPFEHCLRVFQERRRWSMVADLISPTAQDTRERPRWHAARQKVQRALPLVVDAAGLPMDETTPHRMRRTYAVHYLEEVDGDITKLQKHMGWASIQTAAAYVDHSQRRELDEVGERMRQRIRRRKKPHKPKDEN